MSKCFIDFSDAVIWQGKAWFFSNDFNGLYSVNLSNQEIEFKGRVPFEPQLEQYLYSSLVIFDNKIYLIPFKAKKMAIYDTITGGFEPMELSDIDKPQFFNGTCLYNDCLFLFHFFDATILKIDLKVKKFEVIDEWIDKLTPYLFKESDAHFSYFRKQLVCKEGKIYIPFCYANAVLEIDCENAESNIHVIGTAEQGYAGICEDGEDLWLAPKRRNGAVVRWNPKTGYKDTFQCKDDSDSFAYIGIAKECGQIYLYSAAELLEFPNNSVFKVKPYQYRFVSDSRESILALNINKNTLIIYDKVTGTEKEIVIDTEYENTPLINEFLEKTVKESPAQDLSRLFDAIESGRKCQEKAEQGIGEKIYRIINS